MPKKRLSPAAFDALSAYAFPGNVRELENLIERATVFADGDEILPADSAAAVDSRARSRSRASTRSSARSSRTAGRAWRR